MDNDQINQLIPQLQALAKADREIRETIQRAGIDVIPCNFYSNLPSIQEIENSFEYISDDPPYLDPHIFNHDRCKETLMALIPFADDFSPLTEGNEEDCKEFFWRNSQFSHSDAMAYYCFLRFIKPSAIVEIGAGFSTLVALKAVSAIGACDISCIEPFPRDFIKNEQRIFLHKITAQQVTADFLNDSLSDNDVLFIDSTHTVKSGSDCLHIYLRLIPKIRRNIFIHVHDVFLPFAMPLKWLLEKQIYWTEQYLLYAFLLDNPKAQLIYGSHFNMKYFPKLVQQLMGNKANTGGGSVWFKYNGRNSIF